MVLQDLISDFYKRYTHDGGIAGSVKCPASVVLFGAADANGSLPTISLALSFGAETAFRVRGDGRLVLSRTDSDAQQSVNKIDVEKFSGADWADEIFKAFAKLPVALGGAELLMHTDVGLPEFSPRKLCAVQAAAKAFSRDEMPSAILRAADYPPYYLTSLIENARAAAINTTTLEYLPYSFKLAGKKIVIARIQSKRNIPKSTVLYREHERTRINRAAGALSDGDIDLLGIIMREASFDMLSAHKSSSVGALFEYASEFTHAVRVMVDFAGIIAFVADPEVDKFVAIVGDRYEKKTGIRPAFYISD